MDTYTEDRKEQLRRETGFLTNFDSDRLPIYQKAIEEYHATGTANILRIGEASNRYCDYGLYRKQGNGDLGPFWRIFDRIEAEQKASAV